MSVYAYGLSQSVAEKKTGPISDTLQTDRLVRLAVQLLQPEA